MKGMKFAGWRALAANLGAAMAEIWDLGTADALTWVPLSRRRRARRDSIRPRLSRWRRRRDWDSRRSHSSSGAGILRLRPGEEDGTAVGPSRERSERRDPCP
jgi:hypothetical protein